MRTHKINRVRFLSALKFTCFVFLYIFIHLKKNFSLNFFSKIFINIEGLFLNDSAATKNEKSSFEH